MSHAVAALYYELDAICRYQLHTGRITREDDYTSNLCGLIHYRPIPRPYRYRFWPYPVRSYSRVLDKSEEYLFGCDAIILVQIKKKIKVGLFEAKWPRIVTSTNHRWDNLQADGNSHFHDQLKRQKRWATSAAIWEMFYYEERPSQATTPFDLYGSTCAWHEVAYDYDRTLDHSQRWSNSNLIDMLNTRPSDPQHRSFGMNLFDILLRFLSCKKGLPISMRDYTISLESEGEAATIPIPSFDENLQVLNLETIDAFMGTSGISSYLHIEIDDPLEIGFA